MPPGFFYLWHPGKELVVARSSSRWREIKFSLLRVEQLVATRSRTFCKKIKDFLGKDKELFVAS